MQSLLRLCYTSQAVHPFTPADMAALLDDARLRNAQRGITGMLLYHGDSFFQTLEGPEIAVESIFDRISQDPRHSGVDVALRQETDVRAFGEWAMGYVDPGVLKPEKLMALEKMRSLICRTTYDPELRMLMTGFLSGHKGYAIGKTA